MKKIDLTKIDWSLIQKEHNEGLYWTKIPQKFGFCKAVLERAKNESLIKKVLHPYKHNEVVRNDISIKRKAFWKNNSDKHFWKNINKFKSIQCEILKKELILNNINFVEEYKPIKGRHYRIDISFPDKKIGIEINGNQHYENHTILKKYYKDRNRIIEADGWKIFDLHYKKVYDKDFIQSFIDKIKKDYGLSNVDYSSFIIIKQKKIKQTQIEYYNNLRITLFNSVHKKRIELIKNSNIDFKKFGYAKKVGELTGMVPQKVKLWMIKYMPDFYNEKCFKKTDRFGLSRVKKYGSKEEHLKHRQQQSIDLTNKRIKIIKEQNVSLNKTGWSVKLSKLFNINKSSVAKWVRNNKEYIFTQLSNVKVK